MKFKIVLLLLILFIMPSVVQAQVGIKFPVNIPVGEFGKRAGPMLGVGMGLGVGFGSWVEMAGNFTFFPHFTKNDAEEIGHVDLYDFRGLIYMGPKPKNQKFTFRLVAGGGRVWNDLPRFIDPASGPKWNWETYAGTEMTALVASNIRFVTEVGYNSILETGDNFDSIRLSIGGQIQLGKK